MRCVGRPAAGQHIHQLKIREGLDDGKQRHHHRHRQQQRPGNMDEALPAIGAVDRRGFLQFRADGLQPRQQADRVEWHAAPNIHDNHGREGEIGVAQPVDPALDQAQVPQQPVEHAESRIEHPFPGEGGQHRGNNEGQQDEGTHPGLALEIPVQQLRQPQAKHQLEYGCDESVPAGIPHRRAEDRIVPDFLEIL